MNDKQFFEKIELKRFDGKDCMFLNTSNCIKGCVCKYPEPPKITADHIIALEGLIKWPYSFEFIDCSNDTHNNYEYVLFKRQETTVFYNHAPTRDTRKEALKALISWMIDENILTKDEVKAVFNA